jgi:hypothetical protein
VEGRARAAQVRHGVRAAAGSGQGSSVEELREAGSGVFLERLLQQRQSVGGVAEVELEARKIQGDADGVGCRREA